MEEECAKLQQEIDQNKNKLERLASGVVMVSMEEKKRVETEWDKCRVEWGHRGVIFFGFFHKGHVLVLPLSPVLGALLCSSNSWCLCV